MNDPYEFVPPFVSPLTHDQHARLGRIAILWGQIDMTLDQLLQIAINITGEQRITLIGEKPIGAKLDMLSGNIKNIPNKEGQRLVREFLDLTNQTKTMRNRCFHGVWGFHCGKPNKVTPAASHFKERENPVRVSQLPALEKKLCKTARTGWDAIMLIHQHDLNQRGCNRLFHGVGDTPPWLSEWREQHPLGDHSLDRNWKRGRLPYLAQP